MDSKYMPDPETGKLPRLEVTAEQAQRILHGLRTRPLHRPMSDAEWERRCGGNVRDSMDDMKEAFKEAMKEVTRTEGDTSHDMSRTARLTPAPTRPSSAGGMQIP